MLRRASLSFPLRVAALAEVRCLSTEAGYAGAACAGAWRSSSSTPDRVTNTSPWALCMAPSAQQARALGTSSQYLHERALTVTCPQQAQPTRAFASEPASADHVDFLLQAIIQPSSDQLAALRSLFSDFDGEKIIQTGGVLNTLEPHVQKVLVELSAAFQKDADTFNVRQCANILSTMVLLGHFDTSLKDAIVDRVLSDVNNADPELLGAICYCLGVGGYSDRKFFRVMEKLTTEKPDQFSNRALSKVLWMFSRLDYNSEDINRTLGNLVDRILKDNESLSEDLAYGLWACGDNEVYADRIAFRVMQGSFENVSHFGATVIAKLAFGLAQQQVDDDKVYDAMAKRTAEIADEFFPRDIAKLLWAFGNVNYVDRPMLRALEPCILRHVEKFNYNELDMIVTAYNNFSIHNAAIVKVAERMVEVTK